MSVLIRVAAVLSYWTLAGAGLWAAFILLDLRFALRGEVAPTGATWSRGTADIRTPVDAIGTASGTQIE